MELEEVQKQKQLISLTPLIDVVFILLVFFMLASSFAKWHFIELQVGEAENIDVNYDTQSLIIVDFDQHYTLNGKEMSLKTITQSIKNRIKANKNHPILIQPVDDLPLQELMIILESIGGIAESNISLVEQEN